MIATPEILFIHLHKTGGQFVNRLLLQHLPGAYRVGYHLPRSEAPPELKSLPTFAFVRNPWDWYVSWYAFNLAAPERNPIFRTVTDAGRLDFKAAISNMLQLGNAAHTPMREEISAALPEHRENNFGSGITRTVMTGFQDQDNAYFTWLWRYMCSVQGSVTGMHMGKMERMREDLPRLLEACGSRPSVELVRAIVSTPAVNASPRREYRDYYDQELRDMVAMRDKSIIEAYGYSF